MNIPFDQDEMTQLAELIVSGQVTLPYGTTYLHEAHEWLEAAERALDGDFDDLVYMDDRESHIDAFFDWVSKNPKEREDWDFDDWLAGRIEE